MKSIQFVVISKVLSTCNGHDLAKYKCSTQQFTCLRKIVAFLFK